MTKQQKETMVETAEDPVQIPEKFKDAETGEVNTEALIKSYLALEKKLGQKTVGTRPESAEGYQIKIDNPLLKNDAEINKKLFDLGFSNEQVQAVYDLAAEKVVPLIMELSDTVKSDKALAELEQMFGGAEQFNTIARQISDWGEKHLNPAVFETLAGSKDGILTLYQMMCGEREAPLLPRSAITQPVDTEESLKRLMQDPKYWKQPPMVSVSDTFPYRKYYIFLHSLTARPHESRLLSH